MKSFAAAETKNNSSVEQLQVLAVKTAVLAARAEKLLRAPVTRSVTEGLIAIGLCKQAREQVGAACQNLGFAVETLPYITNVDGKQDPSSIKAQMAEAAAGVVELIQQMLNVSEESITPSIEAFVNEMLVIAAITVVRAEEHVKEGEQLLNAKPNL